MITKDFTAIHPAYTCEQSLYIDEMKGWAGLLRHKKTGARVVLVSNDDTNKVFTIGFRTPPKDSTGVAHIIEHTVLCGSDKYPSKDPFVELVKGSLNTFLNAMTYPDKTLYPIASYNDKDFKNLMSVYMDAVFHPNIYKNKKLFLQEGWHYELENMDDPLTYNGVVYNEMKGAYSSPEQLLMAKITKSLFPDTPYGVESGGDPQFIPDLTYEQFLDFHKTYYHPSNSYIYLYGDMDMAERLDYMDREYLSDYEYLSVDSHIEKQTPPGEMTTCIEKYPVAEEDDTEDKYYYAYNTVIGGSLDADLYMAFQIVDYVLMGAPGAVLKKALLDSGIAKDVFGSYDNGICQPYYSIVAKDAKSDVKEQFMTVIRSTLEKVVTDGLNKRSLEAALNYFEFRFREADFGRYPKGLMYGLQMCDSWLYDDTKPFIHIQVYETFEHLREYIHTDYFEQLIDQYLLHSNHSSLLVLVPERGLTKKQETETAQKLQKIKDRLSEKELQKIIDETKALKLFQETPSTQEELEKIPMIGIEDIKKEAEPLINESARVDEMDVLRHNIGTNGIGYVRLLFDLSHVPDRLIGYAGLLTNVLGNVNTEKYSYTELTDEINMSTGGISTDIAIYQENKADGTYFPKLVVSGKALYHQIPRLFELSAEMLFKSCFDDAKRLREVIDQMKSRLSMYFSSGGHAAAVLRAQSYYSEAACFKERTSGIAFYDFIKDLQSNFETKKEEITASLYEVSQCIFRKENVLVDMTADTDGFRIMDDALSCFDGLWHTGAAEKGKIHFEAGKYNEAFLTPGMVQFDACAGNFMKSGFQYHGALQILKVIMDYDYLWNEIRVKGGAYGCMCGFASNGDAYFVTYRDPKLKESYEVFKNAAAYVKNFECSDRDMTKYIIGAISNIDIPMNPNAKGARSLACYLSGITYEDKQRTRDELLGAKVSDIRKLGSLIEAFVEEDYKCVVGSESQIKANEAMFRKVRQL